MSYSELAQYGQEFDRAVRGGSLCGGDKCQAWFLSELDSWHMCPCNKTKNIMHPEMDEGDLGLPLSDEEKKNIIACYATNPDIVIPDDDVPF